ncbi:efflux RND transporter periplasmic adaptor subunit [Fontisphaera persica]|uniref:efflux RND transporter periplasmic adaptor subunit n=1 Tax=Fontisphaera persica TaxID=2974023 RepID=UPI0024C00B94|nr:efflux RND transporter periplasmic adaptor subunit [Fontisphaera persica]WCJ60329.1 efflux RND transporter periplasmic adaptor subunit [Fontisphaera persica]
MMNLKFAVITSIAALALLAGCKKQEAAGEDDGHGHAGHKHAKAVAAPQGADGATAQVPLSGAKCAAHQAPKELCFICDASLREKGRLWCEEHKRYEDRCFECHPELQDKNRLWCKEHSLYEDECSLCHPELKGKGKPAAASGAVLMCAEHGVPEAECAVCRPDAAAKLKPGESLKVRLPSTNSTAIVGVRTSAPERGAIADGIECVAEVSFNQNKLAQIAAPVSGIIQTVDADLGTKVEEKQTVAKIWSASIAEAVAKAVLSHQTLDRERKLRADRVTSQAALDEAEATHRAACQQLRTLGFTEEQIDEMGHKPQEQVLMEVRAPFAGEISERMAVRGALVEVGKPLFTLVDHATVWAMLQVPEGTLGRVKAGQAVELRVDSLPGKVFTGKLTWVSPAVDERTRMARARAEFANPDCLLKDKMFATARILTRKTEGAMLVPPSAIQHVEGRPFVFVKLAEDLFDARAVALGAKYNGRLEVLAGLKPEEQIAVTRAFALKSAMLMSRLGAGCADD